MIRFIRSRMHGVTLIELLVAMAIVLVMTAAIASLFISQSRNLQGQQGVVEVQDNARIALELITRDLRNTGFFMDPSVPLRIEDNCANSNLKIDNATTPPTWRIGTGGAGVQALSAGNAVETVWGAGTQTNGTNGNDACPNGSDRITVAARPRADTVTGCNSLGCAAQSGAGNNYDIPCEGPPPGCAGNAACESARCSQAMEKVCDGCGAYCSGCPSNVAINRTLTLCDGANPLVCFEAILEKATNCCTNSGTLPNGMAVQLTFNFPGGQSFSGADWNFVGGKDDDVNLTGFVYRTYQLLDMDGDGATELVYSDKFHSAIVNAAAPTASANFDPQWTIVAYGIEDLQFAWSKRNTPTTFMNNITLWNTPGCTASAGVYDCLEDLVVAGGGFNPPMSVRVSAVVRTLRREVGADDQTLAGGRPALENNAGDNSAAALGYRRRMVSTTIGLRNLQSAGTN